MTAVFVFLTLLSNPIRDSDLEQRVMALSQQFRCLVCQNETIADSHADLAADLRQQIREQIIAGRSDAQITAFLTDRYGDFVLYRPRLAPRTYALWFGPFLLLGGGLFWLFVFVKRWPRSRTRRTLTPEEHRRAEELLESATDPNVNIYRDQFDEMESNFRAGFVPQEQYEHDREELQGRLLEDCRQSPGKAPDTRSHRRRN
jgi:cytochrome c-type biogenesis protein CcmH